MFALTDAPRLLPPNAAIRGVDSRASKLQPRMAPASCRVGQREEETMKGICFRLGLTLLVLGATTGMASAASNACTWQPLVSTVTWEAAIPSAFSAPGFGTGAILIVRNPATTSLF